MIYERFAFMNKIEVLVIFGFISTLKPWSVLSNVFLKENRIFRKHFKVYY